MPRFPLRVLTSVDREEKADTEYHFHPGHNQVSYPGRLMSHQVLQMARYRHFHRGTLIFMQIELSLLLCGYF